MNLANWDKAIDVMERVKARGDTLNMGSWQAHTMYTVQAKESQLHTCGTAACFAGWVAVSPEFQKDGGEVMKNGAPMIEGHAEDEAIAEWLGIDDELAENLCAMGAFHDVYGKPAEEITVDDVIEKLYELRGTVQ